MSDPTVDVRVRPDDPETAVRLKAAGPLLAVLYRPIDRPEIGWQLEWDLTAEAATDLRDRLTAALESLTPTPPRPIRATIAPCQSNRAGAQINDFCGDCGHPFLIHTHDMRCTACDIAHNLTNQHTESGHTP